MSKRLSSSQSNTLLNYFQSPKSQKKEEKSVKKDPKEDESDEEPVHGKKKRIRIIADSDSESENHESPKRTLKKAKVTTPKSGIDKLAQFSFGNNDESQQLPQTPKKHKKSTSNDSESALRWLHEKLPFLQPDKLRDANKNKVNDPNYNPRTLFVPKDYLDSLTPAMRQWWILKSQHFDTVFFFKVGKFYELYHMDAVIGVEKLGFSFMRGEFAHSGFPESAYGRMAQSLIEQGFSVARIEQTETPEMMAERCKGKKATKFDKVVNREICQISMKGATLYNAQLCDAKQSAPTYMMAICETESKSNQRHFGVCFLDVSIGTFNIGDFDDDKHYSRLLTLRSQHYPSLVLLEKGRTMSETSQLLKTHLSDVKIEMLASDKEFPSVEKTVEILKSGCYFKDEQGNFQWPKELENLLLDNSTVKPEYQSGIRSLGACICYLKKCCIDIQIMQMKKFALYQPVDLAKGTSQAFMVLDSVTLDNLKILGSAGTLQKTLDYCVTPFGQRLIQQWICKPLCFLEKIERRQEAVKELFENVGLLKSAREILAKLPDLDRQIVKLHTFGNAYCSKFHPDSRAVLYESKTYNKRKIGDLMSTLQAFENLLQITPLFSKCESKLLRKISQFPPAGSFVNLKDHLTFFKGAFNQEQAKEEGTIIPERGVDQEYDAVLDNIKCIEQDLASYLKEQSKIFKCEVKYFGNDKKRFQLEIPDNRNHLVTSEYQLETTKKGKNPCKRYSTIKTKGLLAQMMKAESERAKIIQDLNRKIFQMFSDKYDDWTRVVQLVAILDCICCLAEYARLSTDDICLPKMMPFSDNPICRIEDGRHPSIATSNFVPNNIELGSDENASLMILTGPNMGGKSTLMRQTALITILAHVGSYVPASFCEMTLVDRIFTRLGARDDIIKGQSTFLVELTEAAAILQHATKYSFVLLDELGRGTSTHDGNAIATAYVYKLTGLMCRIIFSTHYHNLVEHFSGRNDVQLGYMLCMVEEDPETRKERVTFLYKLTQGLCPKSYGFHVASLAGLPDKIVNRARNVARDFEILSRNRKIVQQLSN